MIVLDLEIFLFVPLREETSGLYPERESLMVSTPQSSAANVRDMSAICSSVWDYTDTFPSSEAITHPAVWLSERRRGAVTLPPCFDRII